MNKEIQRGLALVKAGGHRAALVGGSLLASLPAFATDPVGPDVAPITAAAVTVGTIGVAVFAVYVGIKVFKWAQRAL